jgi:molybdate transport system substrate-binding protein
MLVALSAGAASAQTSGVTLYAAGSLRAALTEVAQAFEASQRGVPVKLVFGASGLLRERLQRGEPADLFASANMGHPQALADALPGGARVRRFARNAMCVLARDGVDVSRESRACSTRH